jgi:hypothetical protein
VKFSVDQAAVRQHAMLENQQSIHQESRPPACSDRFKKKLKPVQILHNLPKHKCADRFGLWA